MITCPVLRCTNPGSDFVVDGRSLTAGYREAYVCAQHQAMIQAGSPWDMQGRDVLMGQDLVPTLANWSAHSGPWPEGFTLTLEIAGHIRPVEVFLTPTEARALATFINEPHTSPYPGSVIRTSANNADGRVPV